MQFPFFEVISENQDAASALAVHSIGAPAKNQEMTVALRFSNSTNLQ
jgi:hypothetical protein